MNDKIWMGDPDNGIMWNDLPAFSDLRANSDIKSTYVYSFFDHAVVFRSYSHQNVEISREIAKLNKFPENGF